MVVGSLIFVGQHLSSCRGFQKYDRFCCFTVLNISGEFVFEHLRLIFIIDESHALSAILSKTVQSLLSLAVGELPTW